MVDDDSQTVGFLDLRDLGPEAVVDRLLAAFSQLGHDAIVTVYCTCVDADALTAACCSHGLDLVHSVPYVDGATFVLQRSNPAPTAHA